MGKGDRYEFSKFMICQLSPLLFLYLDNSLIPTYRTFPMTSVIAKKDITSAMCPVILFEFAFNSPGKTLTILVKQSFQMTAAQQSRERLWTTSCIVTSRIL